MLQQTEGQQPRTSKVVCEMWRGKSVIQSQLGCYEANKLLSLYSHHQISASCCSSAVLDHMAKGTGNSTAKTKFVGPERDETHLVRCKANHYACP